MQLVSFQPKRLLLGCASFFFLIFHWVQAVQANTFTVTSMADDGVTTTNVGTIRWAVTQANLDAAMDTINFDTTAMGGTVITLQGDLTVTNPITLDGGNTVVISGTSMYFGNNFYFTSPGCAGSLVKNIAFISASRGIEVAYPVTVTGCRIGTDWSGNAGEGNGYGIHLYGNGSIIGMPGVANRNIFCSNGTAIALDGAVNAKIQNNYIGVLSDGITPLLNLNAILTLTNGMSTPGIKNSLIGGNRLLGEGNVIVAYQSDKIGLAGADTSGNTICGNILGMSADLSQVYPGMYSGIDFSDIQGNWIGLPQAGFENIIAGGESGITLTGAFARSRNNIVQNNYIGIDPAGDTYTGNGWGLQIMSADNNVVGGRLNAANYERNYISGNLYFNVYISGNGNTVAGNYLGVDLAGNNAQNAATHTNLQVEGSGNLIGGPNPDPAKNRGNVISGCYYQVLLATSGGNTLVGNYIGTNAAGNAAVAGSVCGVYMDYNAQSCQVGGAGFAYRNVISGNSGDGIAIGGVSYASSNNNRIEGNYINLSADGTVRLALPNSNGIHLATGCGNLIGGSGPGAGNFICAGLYGITLDQAATSGNTLVGNFIGMLPNGNLSPVNMTCGIYNSASAGNWVGYANGGVGNLITAANSGMVLAGASTFSNGLFGNTVCGVSTAGISLQNGANRNLAAPVITSATSGVISGVSPANAYIEVFRAGNGTVLTALQLLGHTTADASGHWSLTPVGYATGEPVTALATDNSNNTSAFGTLGTLITPTATPTPVATATAATPSATATPAPTFAKDSAAYPNPARERVHFAWKETQAQHAKIVVYDLLGEAVKVIQSDQPALGADWQISGMAPGIYLYQVELVVNNEKRLLPIAKLAIIR